MLTVAGRGDLKSNAFASICFKIKRVINSEETDIIGGTNTVMHSYAPSVKLPKAEWSCAFSKKDDTVPTGTVTYKVQYKTTGINNLSAAHFDNTECHHITLTVLE